MWRILESIRGSYAGRMAPPGMPKMTSVPAASSDVIRLCAPVICFAHGFLSYLSWSLAVTRDLDVPHKKAPRLPGNEG